MDDRGYVAQAFFDRLSREGARFRVLGDPGAYPDGKRLWDWAAKAAQDRGYRLGWPNGSQTEIVPI